MIKTNSLHDKCNFFYTFLHMCMYANTKSMMSPPCPNIRPNVYLLEFSFFSSVEPNLEWWFLKTRGSCIFNLSQNTLPALRNKSHCLLSFLVTGSILPSHSSFANHLFSFWWCCAALKLVSVYKAVFTAAHYLQNVARKMHTCYLACIAISLQIPL